LCEVLDPLPVELNQWQGSIFIFSGFGNLFAGFSFVFGGGNVATTLNPFFPGSGYVAFFRCSARLLSISNNLVKC
jgi:hypothetical protein